MVRLFRHPTARTAAMRRMHVSAHGLVLCVSVLLQQPQCFPQYAPDVCCPAAVPCSPAVLQEHKVWVEDPAHPEGGSWEYEYAITNVEYTGASKLAGAVFGHGDGRPTRIVRRLEHFSLPKSLQHWG